MKDILKKRILIIDDEPINISLIAEVLNQDYELLVTTDPKAGLDIAKRELPSLILLDIVMPGLDGYQVASELKKEPFTQEIPIVFLTAKSDPASIVKGFNYGAVDYISKPFVKEELLARVATHLKVHSLNSSLQKTILKLQHYADIMDEHIISSSTDLEGNITGVSKAYERLSGYTQKELIGKNHNITRDKDMPDALFKELWETITHDKIYNGEIKSRAKSGESYWFDVTIIPVLDDNNDKKIGYTALRQNITSKKRIEELSIRDDLTGLFNRRHFNQVFESEYNRARRQQEHILFMMMDVDHFKLYNDTYGHQEGDYALEKIGKVFNNSTKRSSEFAFRLGGEEFGIIAHNKTKEDALAFAQQIRESVKKLKIPHEKNSASPYITVSIGLFFRKVSKDDTVNKIYKTTDNALYKAKSNGRDRVENCYD